MDMETPEIMPCLPIECVNAGDLTYQDFVKDYFEPRKPALFRNACADWDFIRRWTQDYLREKMGDFECTIARDSRPAYSEEICSLSEYFEHYAHLSTMTFKSYDAGHSDLPVFLQDIPLPNPFFSQQDIGAYFFFHANAQGGSLPHCHMDAFNLLQYGTKRWIMWDADPDISPEGWRLLKQCHAQYGTGTFSYDWFANGPEQVRQEGVATYECEQQAGDIVFIPEHYSHAVLNMSENQGMVVITKRPDKTYQKEVDSGYSPNHVYA